MSTTKVLALVLGILGVVSLISWGGDRAYQYIQFNRTVAGYLKRAADSNTIELATENMQTAITNATARGVTTGYTSIIYQTPNEDIGFWFSNLTASLKELQSIPVDAPLLEKSNILLKLRQTLLDHDAGTETVTVPPGITIFPSNAFFAFWMGSSLGLIIIFVIAAMMA